jgi:hypothetical protein
MPAVAPEPPPRSAAAAAAIRAATAAAARLAAGRAAGTAAWPPSGSGGPLKPSTAGWGAVARARAGAAAGRSPSPPPPPSNHRKRAAAASPPAARPLSKKAARKAAKAASASAASKFGWAAGPPGGRRQGGGEEEGGEEDLSRLDPAERARRLSRAGRFGSGAADGAASGAAARGRALDATAARRAAATALASRGPGGGGGGGGGEGEGAADDDAAWDALAVKGTSTSLEKSYFRLTAPPDPASVRPEPVLRAALDRLVALIAAGSVSYFYAADQFKGLRQDCTVQRLRGPLTAAVYEAHARAALAYGDAAEYTQCQAQIEWLHREIGSGGGGGGSGVGAIRGGGGGGRGGPASPDPPPPSPPYLHTGAHPSSLDEFAAYRVLYQAMHGLGGAAGERVALLRTLQKLGGVGGGGGRPSAGPALAHALAVVSAAAARDGPAFFALYGAAPRCGRAVMDIGAPALRFALLRALCGAVRPLLPLPLLSRALGFTPPPAPRPGSPLARLAAACAALDGATPGTPLPGCDAPRLPGKCAPAGLSAAAAWAAAHGAVVVDASTGAPVDLATVDPASLAIDGRACTGQLFVPEDTAAVAHGDANLAVEDFLARAFK